MPSMGNRFEVALESARMSRGPSQPRVARAPARSVRAAALVLLATACSRPDTPATAPASEGTEVGSFPDLRIGQAWFVDRTAQSGLDFVHQNGATEAKQLPETMGAGAALFDFDRDGDLDLYCVQSGPLPAMGSEPGTFALTEQARPTNRLFENDGTGRFRDVTSSSGAAALAAHGQGVAVGDANGDGHLDLFVANLGPSALLLGDGKGSFTDATRASGIADARWTSSAAFVDVDRDEDLDLFTVSYVDIDLARPEWCGERKPGWRSYCHPDRYRGLEDRLWIQREPGRFVEEGRARGLDDANGKGLCALASDLDGDGFADVYVANDSTENRHYAGSSDGRLVDATLLAGTGLDRYGRTEASMGVASGDVDGDLDLDLFVTGFDDESDTLYVNQGGGVFEDRTVQAGLELATRLPVGFGTVLEDFDGDGDLDLAIANGHIIDNIALYHDGKTHAQPALLFENDGKGRFTDVSSQLGGDFTRTPFVGRGLYTGDVNGDGASDLVLTQNGGPTLLFVNQNGTSQLSVDGLPFHARVRAHTRSGRTLVRETGPQPSYYGASAPGARFGLEGDPAVKLSVRIADGAWQEIALEPPLAFGRVVLEVRDGRVAHVR